MKHELRDERGLSSLSVAGDMAEWWRAWGPQIAAQHGKQGWILFLLDSLEKLQEVSMLLSRVLRDKPEWDSRGWSEAEWLNVQEQTEQAYAWFVKNAESPLRDAPEWGKFLFSAVHGEFMVGKRLGRELRAVQEQGYHVATIDRAQNCALGGDAAEILVREAD